MTLHGGVVSVVFLYFCAIYKMMQPMQTNFYSTLMKYDRFYDAVVWRVL